MLVERGQADESPLPAPTKLELEGLHNVFRVGDRIVTGSGPEGEKAFAALQTLGIKTVISVDGARPDVARARKYGLRYVHIPLGYGGVSRQQALRIAKAVRELPGPFYIHCHHGKHRGPTAAAIARLCTGEKCGVADALAVLRSAGTDPRYRGLFQGVQQFREPTAQELAALPAEFPEVVPVVGVTQAMVTMDHCWDNLKLVRAAGWKTPPGHPDIDPAHEALQLVEGYQELRRLPEVAKRPGDFRTWVAEGHASAKDLEELLRVGREKKAVDADAAEKLYRRAGAVCTQCHAKYRDVPQQP
jgi:protein tyrosine phosphatase (PTP) superfamily phosphohydrolase (DUF442 family)